MEKHSSTQKQDGFRFVLYGGGSGTVYGVSNAETIDAAWAELKNRVVRYAAGDADSMAAMEKKGGHIDKSHAGFLVISLPGSDEGAFGLADLQSPDPQVQSEIGELGLVNGGAEFRIMNMEGNGNGKAVGDHTQSAEIREGMITITSSVGGGASVTIPIQEWLAGYDLPDPKPTHEELIRSYTGPLDHEPCGAQMAAQIREAMASAIEAAFANARVNPKELRDQQLGISKETPSTSTPEEETDQAAPIEELEKQLYPSLQGVPAPQPT